MSSQTTNIGLTKQTGVEINDLDILNSNLDILDEEIGKRGKTVNGTNPDSNGNYQISEVQFARQLVTDGAQQSSGDYLFRTTGGEASISSGDAKLMRIYGRSSHEGRVQESLEMEVRPAAREEGEPITAVIDRNTFVGYVVSSGTTTLTYTDAWSANPTLYGVTVTGTPVSGDQIIIVYVKEDLGTIINSNPQKFISTGWNLYNHILTYAHVKKYDSANENLGFLIGGAYTSLKFSETTTGSKTNIVPSNGWFQIPSDGYVWVTGGNATTTYILRTWTDWTEGYAGDWEPYSESTIDFSEVMSEAFPDGMYSVGAFADELDFGLGKAISRIERIDYSDADLENVISSGKPYDYDVNYIYTVRDSEVSTDFEISGDFTADDHGQELIDGGTVAPNVQTTYGENLVDKLRTDVVTKSTDLINKLNYTEAGKALDARQGKVLKDRVDLAVSEKSIAPSSLANLAELLNAAMMELAINECRAVKIVPSATFGLFTSGKPYYGTLYRGGSTSTSYGMLSVAAGNGTIQDIYGSCSNNTWTFKRIPTDDQVMDVIAPLKTTTFSVPKGTGTSPNVVAGKKTLKSSTGTLWLITTHFGVSSGLLSMHLAAFGSASYAVKTIISSNYVTFTGDTGSQPATINNSNTNYDVMVSALRLDGSGNLTVT